MLPSQLGGRARSGSEQGADCVVFALGLHRVCIHSGGCIGIAAPLHAVCTRASNLLPTLHRLCNHFASNASQKAAQNLVVEHKGLSNADGGLWVGLVLVSWVYAVGQDPTFVRRLFDGHFATMTDPGTCSTLARLAPS
jgi:hypothetical protein